MFFIGSIADGRRDQNLIAQTAHSWYNYDKSEEGGGCVLAKVVLVTGGSRGIGAAVCRKFAAEGYAVAVNYQTSREKAEAVAAECGGTAVQADVSDRVAVDAMFDIVEATLGQVSVLVNNAGIQQIGLFQDCRPEDWERMFAVNVRGVYHCCERALPAMLREQSGAIVNVSSVWGLCGGSCESHLLRREGRRHRLHQGAGEGVGSFRHPGQLRGARRRRDRHERVALRSGQAGPV
jgi:hypothetical protein